MEVRPFKEFKRNNNLVNITVLLILASGIYLLWNHYRQSGTVSWVGILFLLSFLIIQFYYFNFYRDENVSCPKCKSKCFPSYEQMENEKETWVQIKFPCEKCGIIWDTEDRINVNNR